MKTVGSEEHHETWAAHSRSADFSPTRAAGYPITRYGLLRRWHRHARPDKRHRRQQWYRVARPIPRAAQTNAMSLHVQSTRNRSAEYHSF